MSRYQPNESERYPEGILKAFGYEAGSDDVPYRVYLTSDNPKERKGFELDPKSGNITTVIEDIMIDRLSRYSREFHKTIRGDFSYLKIYLQKLEQKLKETEFLLLRQPKSRGVKRAGVK